MPNGRNNPFERDGVRIHTPQQVWCNMSEHDEQVVFFDWLEWMSKPYPELKLFYAIPNGAKVPYKKVGKKVIAPERAWLIKEGLKAGMLDTCLPVPKRGYHGMFIEFKFGKNKPSEKQLWWLKMLNEQGYYAVICYGFEEAKKHVEWYMGIEEDNRYA